MHLLSTSRYAQKDDLDKLFRTADLMQKPHVKGVDLFYQARGKVLAIVKDEGSTRTRMSFEVAMKRLGGEVTLLELDKKSSVAKGETLEDTIRTVSEYVDVIVLRHSQKGAVEKASAFSMVPVINAGDGDGEHPTQALLDVYTMYKEFGGLDGINIMLVGDLRHSRTVHSLLHLLTLYKDVKVQLVSPPDLMLPAEYYGMLRSKGIEPAASSILEKRLSLDTPDVVYVVREQMVLHLQLQTLLQLVLQPQQVLTPLHLATVLLPVGQICLLLALVQAQSMKFISVAVYLTQLLLTLLLKVLLRQTQAIMAEA
jgi:aspartate carbamoyltransferase